MTIALILTGLVHQRIAALALQVEDRQEAMIAILHQGAIAGITLILVAGLAEAIIITLVVLIPALALVLVPEVEVEMAAEAGHQDHPDKLALLFLAYY